MPNGKIYIINDMMGSGLYCTSLVNSIINYVMWHEARHKMNMEEYDCVEASFYCQGDDSIEIIKENKEASPRKSLKYITPTLKHANEKMRKFNFAVYHYVKDWA